MKKAVMYGAGNIGRGFIGKVFSDSGYEVCFLDIDKKVIEAFNKDHEYTVRIVSDDAEVCETVGPVYAVNANTEEAVGEIASCDIMATAVGVNVLPHIIHTIAEGLKLRKKVGGRPLNIILAENQLDVDQLMREWIYAELTEGERQWADENLGLVEASIGRMVPPLTPGERKKNPLLIAVEPYAELPVDLKGFKGELPKLAGLRPFSPFRFYVKRKLFLHNMGHAICAYLGWRKGYEYIYEAIRDEEIHAATKRAMNDSVEALSKEYPQVPRAEIEANRDDLLARFHNKALKDTVERVAADPVRKLRSNDRLVGAALYCLEQGVDPAAIIRGIAAALRYDNQNDPAAMRIQADIQDKGLDYVLEYILQIDIKSELAGLIKEAMR